MIERVTPATVNDERTMLIEFLNYYRETLYSKTLGLNDEQARITSVSPSDLSLMGLIRHMSDVERWWFINVLDASDIEPLYWSDEEGGDPDGDLHPIESDSISESIRVWRNEIKNADNVISNHQIDDIITIDRKGKATEYNMRWILIHMIEEYARHCGHADLLRECIDGVVGD